ncbi:hypothetical protein U1Q18_014467 [Sarracenia purpurea var. burkii]
MRVRRTRSRPQVGFGLLINPTDQLGLPPHSAAAPLPRARQGRSPLNKEALEAVVEWLAWYRDSPPPAEKSKSSDGVFGTRDLLTNDEGKEDKQAVPVAGASLKLANDGSDSAILEISVSKAVGDGNVVVGDEEEAVVTELDPASMVGDEVICSRSAPIFFDGKKLCDVACPAKNVLIDENICPVSSISRRMRNVEYKEKQLGVKNGGSERLAGRQCDYVRLEVR